MATLKISTQSVNSALTKAGVKLATFSDATARCTGNGCAVTTWNHGWEHGKIQKVSHVRYASKPTNGAWHKTEEQRLAERTAWLADMTAALEAARDALTTAGYMVSTSPNATGFNPDYYELTVTLP